MDSLRVVSAQGVTQPPPNIISPVDEGSGAWLPFEIQAVHSDRESTLVSGRVDYKGDEIEIGILQQVATVPGIPAFIRAKAERRGIVDFTTLSQLEPIVIDAYLDCPEYDDLEVWRDALKGFPSAQNSVGWRMSFGRHRDSWAAQGQFSRPNWLGAKDWFCMAAAKGYPSALNNLASNRMLAVCGVAAGRQDEMRQRLYACANTLEGSRGEPNGAAWRHALNEAKELVAIFSS